eukprot:Amastigsp_a683310_4.p2 type:complete len:139 gc:universal Amastigsp_a683310_4:998-582(-)
MAFRPQPTRLLTNSRCASVSPTAAIAPPASALRTLTRHQSTEMKQLHGSGRAARSAATLTIMGMIEAPRLLASSASESVLPTHVSKILSNQSAGSSGNERTTTSLDSRAKARLSSSASSGVGGGAGITSAARCAAARS